MIKITDKPDYIGLISSKRFNCPNCETEIIFRQRSQVVCYKCGKPLLDITGLLKTLTTRILYHNNDLIS